jgi:hypothetical protein
MVVSVPRCSIPWVMSRARTDRLPKERRDQRCAAIASRQFGLISRAQALGEGLSADAIDHRLGAGRWERLLPGVFRIAGAPASWHQHLMAAILWAPRAAVSHQAAAALWELEGCPSDRVELSTVSTRKSRVPWITLHRVGTLDRADVTSLGPIPVTTPTRTLADLCGVLNPDAVERALDDALRRNLTSMPRLRWAAQRLGGRGRPGAHVLRELIGQRGGDWTPPASVLESSERRLLKQAGLPDPAPQWEVRERGRLLARVDLAYPETKVAIEADGYRFHSGRLAWHRDLARRNTLTSRGWQVLHVTWEDLTNRQDAVVSEVRAALDRGPTS